MKISDKMNEIIDKLKLLNDLKNLNKNLFKISDNLRTKRKRAHSEVKVKEPFCVEMIELKPLFKSMKQPIPNSLPFSR